MLIRSAGIIQPLSQPITEINSDSPQAHGLVGCWPAYSALGGGSRLYDLSGRARHGVITGAAWKSVGRYGRSVNFAEGNYIRIQSSGVPILAGRADATVIGVIRTTAGSITKGRPIYAERPSSTPIFKLDSLASNNAAGLTLRDADGTLKQLWCTTPINDGVTHVVAGRVRGTYVDVWTDGRLENSSTVTGLDMLNFPASTPVEIGRDPSDTFSMYSGDIMEVRVYDRFVHDAVMEEIAHNPFDLYRPRKRIVYSIPDAGGTPEPVTLSGYLSELPLVQTLSALVPSASKAEGLQSVLPLVQTLSATVLTASQASYQSALQLEQALSAVVPSASMLSGLICALPLEQVLALVVGTGEPATVLSGMLSALPLDSRISAVVATASRIEGVAVPLPLEGTVQAVVPSAATAEGLLSELPLEQVLSLIVSTVTQGRYHSVLDLKSGVNILVPVASELGGMIAALPLYQRLSIINGVVLVPNRMDCSVRPYYQITASARPYYDITATVNPAIQ